MSTALDIVRPSVADLVERYLSAQLKLWDATAGYATTTSDPNWRTVELAWAQLAEAHRALVEARRTR